MIVKKIKNPDKSSTKAERIKGLLEYILSPGDGSEKCTHWGANGFITDAQSSIIAEMIALSEDAVRSKDTVNHYILSWQDDEQPSHEQVDESVSVFLSEMGLDEHQTVYALHTDTHNFHVHIAVNRVHPDSIKCVEINRGFDIEAAHKAVAKIENIQGWKREAKGRYIVLETGDLARAHIDGEAQRKAPQDKRDMERRTGEKSAVTIAIEVAAPIIKSVSSWEKLHEQLAKEGMTYERKGSGAVILVGDTPVKASDVSRDASFGRLQKRLGVFSAPQISGTYEKKREPEPIKPGLHGWDEYISRRKSYHADKAAAKARLDVELDGERVELYTIQRQRRQQLLSQQSWKGRGDVLNALRSVLAAEQAAEKEAMKERHKQRRENWRMEWRPLPDFESWLREQGEQGHADHYRYDVHSRAVQFRGHDAVVAPPQDIRLYRGQIIDGVVYYAHRDNPSDGADFVDRGESIDLIAESDSSESATLAAMQLAAMKWGSITVTGDADHKALCARLAVMNGIKINNDDMQDMLNVEKEKLKEARKNAHLKQTVEFERYHGAVKAERYRVTVIKMHGDGSKKTFILDKRDGESKGFSVDELKKKIPEMINLQRRGENIYYTPLSSDKHHILIDDMTEDALTRLEYDGYRPSVVMESSPGNYQAIITVPKLGTPHDRDVGNRLAERLNKEYGDMKLSGCIHPHRAPGFENRKPKHVMHDGIYPEVNLIRDDGVYCDKTKSVSKEIDLEYSEKAKIEKKEKPTVKKVECQPGNAFDAYYLHCEDILSRLHGATDLSRLDAMIAVRLRATGHDRLSIQSAIESCAPTIREKNENRNWKDYAARTANYAFGPGGEQQIERLRSYTNMWLKLENRINIEGTKDIRYSP